MNPVSNRIDCGHEGSVVGFAALLFFLLLRFFFFFLSFVAAQHASSSSSSLSSSLGSRVSSWRGGDQQFGHLNVTVVANVGLVPDQLFLPKPF